MAVKKSTVRKKPVVRAKKTAAPAKSVWTLPIAMLMLLLAVSGLSLAVRESSTRTEAATPAATSAVMTPVREAKTPAVTPSANAPSTSASATTAAAPASEPIKPVSITGCLRRDGDAFVLKSTEGMDAPKSRSWKSGFMKRSSSSVSLTEAPSGSHLANHVGERVSVTGPLVDREMHVQSMKRVASTCE